MLLMRNDELAASIRARPGMYFGDETAGFLVECLIDARSSFLGVATVLLERTRVTIRFEGDGADAHAARLTTGTEELSTFAWDVSRAASVEHSMKPHGDGFEISFVPDYQGIPGLSPPDAHSLAGWLRDLATTRPGLHVRCHDERSGLRFSSCFPNGALDRAVQEAGSRSRNPRQKPMRFVGTVDDVSVDVGFTWAAGPGLQIVPLVNGERAPAGGSHVQGFWEGVANGLHAELVSRNLLDPTASVSALDPPRNCVLVVSVHMDEPKWGPATRDCLHSPRARRAVRTIVAESFVDLLGADVMDGPHPPWQLRGGMHLSGSWLERFASAVRDAKPDESKWGSMDPYFHHEHSLASASAEREMREALDAAVKVALAIAEKERD